MGDPEIQVYKLNTIIFPMNYLKILIIPVLLSIIIILLFQHPIDGDSFQYDRLGLNIMQGNGFSLSTNTPYLPTMYREPAYPFFLSAIFILFGHRYLPVQLAQVIVFSLTCLLVYLLSKEIFNAHIARYALIITAFSPPLLDYPAFMYSETLAIFLAVLAIFSLTMSVKRQSLSWYCAAGFALGMAALCKAVIFYFIILAIPCLILKNGGVAWKKKARLIPAFILCFLIATLPWMLRNYEKFRRPMIAIRGQQVLWIRAQKIDYSMGELYKQFVFSFSESLGDMLYPDPGRKRTSDVYFTDSIRSDKISLELMKKGYSPMQIEDIFSREAAAKIKAHPLEYLSLSALEFFKMLSFMYLPSLNQCHIVDMLRSSHNILLKLLISFFKGIIRLYAYFIAVMCIFGIYIKRKEWVKFIFPLLIILYINSVYSLLFGDGRYAVVLIPYYAIFAAVAVDNFMASYKFGKIFHKFAQANKQAQRLG